MLCEFKLNLNLKLAKINMKIGYETHKIINQKILKLILKQSILVDI